MSNLPAVKTDSERLKELMAKLDQVRKIETKLVKEVREIVYKAERQ